MKRSGKKNAAVIIAVLLCFVCVLSLYGCAGKKNEGGGTEGGSDGQTGGPTQEELYNDVLSQYYDAEQNDFYASVDVDERDAKFGALVALELRIYPQPVYYAFVDADGDGASELLIAGSSDGSAYTYYDILKNDGSGSSRIFDMDFGGRTYFRLFNDGVIEISWSNSAFESGMDFYKYNNGTAEYTDSMTVTVNADGNTVYMHNSVEISETDYNELIAGFESAGEVQPEWQAVAEMPQ